MMKVLRYVLGMSLFFYTGICYAANPDELKTDTTLTKAGFFNVRDYGALGNGTTNDGPAIQRAIDSAAAKGGGVVIFPSGRYCLAASLIPKSNITMKGNGLGAVIMATTSFGSAIGQPKANLSNFMVSDLTFEGGVIDEGVFPRRARNYTPSFSSAIAMTGDRKPGGSFPRIQNIIVKNCNILKTRQLPVIFHGVSNGVMVTGCYFENCLDPGFTWCESVQFIGNNTKKGADNGVSVSRQCEKVVIANNIFDDVAYWGIWCSGFVDTPSNTAEPGPDTFSITGNVIRRSGFGGIALLNGPRFGTVSGNTIDTVFNGPTDARNKSQGRGIVVSSFSANGAVIQEARDIVISNNLLRDVARGGISLTGASDILITGNSFINIGATDTTVTKTDFNSGVYTYTTGVPGEEIKRIGIVGNSFVDTRAIPLSNYAYPPAVRISKDSYQKNNTMIGYRQPLAEKLVVGGNGDPDQSVTINAKSGTLRELLFQTAGLRRWDIRVNNVAEAGAQAGSDFLIIRRNDDGTVAGNPITITRSDGAMKLAEPTGKLGFFGQTPIVKYNAIPNTTGATLSALEEELNKLKALVRAYGLMTP
ncbi:Right handed beta helix region [Pedobacter caeni]|uniref:Right handed beta helix region n=2 Tax=Pedobacter caeni TaxID=288992 RepID=A0A1M4ZBM8_9SPHI|nr:Right handed beta helix region [Pedobacter caeni]